MATIREELELVDKFSPAFNRYINFGKNAANSSEMASRAAANYQSVLSGLDRRLITLNSQFTAVANRQAQLVNSGKQNTQEFANLESTAERLGNTIRDLQTQYNLVNAEFQEASSAAKQAASSQDKLNSSLSKGSTSGSGLVSTLKRLAAGWVGIQGVKSLFNLSDAMAQTSARLNRVNEQFGTTLDLNQMIFDSAMRSRGAYQQTADLVGKLGTLASESFSNPQELVAFSEQLNKQFALSGTTADGVSAATLQITQALSSGALRGEELNTVLEQSPTIIQTIGDYLGKSTGEIREMASQGLITSSVIKNALLGAAEETNAEFEKMPLTWSQIWTMGSNVALKALEWVTTGINELANNFDVAIEWISENSDGLTAILMGVGAAAAVVGVQMAASAALSAGAWAVANLPLLLVVAAVAALIYAALKVGATFEDIGAVIGGVLGGIYAFAMNNVIIPFQNAFAAFANFIGNLFNDPVTAIKVLFFDLALSILNKIQGVAKGIQDVLQFIPGLKNINLTAGIDQTISAISGAKQSAIDSGKYTEYVKAWDYVDYSDAISKGVDIGANIGSALDNFSLEGILSTATSGLYDTVGAPLEGISKDVGNIAESTSASEEDLKAMVDIAQRKYINNINLTTKAPVINVSGQNTGSTLADRRAIADTIQQIIAEERASSSYRSTAQVF